MPWSSSSTAAVSDGSPAPRAGADIIVPKASTGAASVGVVGSLISISSICVGSIFGTLLVFSVVVRDKYPICTIASKSKSLTSSRSMTSDPEICVGDDDALFAVLVL